MHDRTTRRPDASEPAADAKARPAPGRVTLTSQLAPVQRKESAAPAMDPSALQLAAEDGVAGASAQLPYHDELRASFGRHGAALDGARAQVGGPAADASAAIGARAYATGDRVAFASTPDRALAAHEAAHVVQQRAGVARKPTLSAASDPFEEHADQVGDAFARGERAEPILDRMPAGAGASVQRDADGAPRSSAGRLAVETIQRAIKIQGLEHKIRSLAAKLHDKGHHWILKDNKGLIEAAKRLTEIADGVVDIWKSATELFGEAPESVKLAEDAVHKAEQVLNGLDLIAHLADNDALADFQRHPDSYERAKAWADDVTGTFSAAAAVLPDKIEGLPVYMFTMWKGLLDAPAAYVSAFERIMDAYRGKIDAASGGGHESTATFSNGMDLSWWGPLTNLYRFAPSGLQKFMNAHATTEGIDLRDAEEKMAAGVLIAALQTAGESDWMAYVQARVPATTPTDDGE